MSAQAIEGHYLETVDDLFFAVKGLIHPGDRFIAILRYAPAKDGERSKGGRRYRRLYHFAEQEDLLGREYPAYLFFEPTLDTIVQGVPHRFLKQIYDPRLKLAELRDRPALAPVEEDALALARLIHDEAGVPWEALGLSGSPLIGLHTPDSDIDLIVYGAGYSRAARDSLRSLLERSYGGLSYLDPAALQRLYAARSADTRMSWADFIRHEGHKTFQAQFRGRDYFIRYVKAPGDREAYGDRLYRAQGRACIRARVVADEDSIFTPCLYRIGEVEFKTSEVLETAEVLEVGLREIVSFRGRFCEQARAGDIVTARGKLEKVIEREGATYYRLLLGEHHDDYMMAEAGR
jgi:predicted nucleotidyltransferase